MIQRQWSAQLFVKQKLRSITQTVQMDSRNVMIAMKHVQNVKASQVNVQDVNRVMF